MLSNEESEAHLKRRVSIVGSITSNSVLSTNKLPELGSDLVAALADLKTDDFSHGRGGRGPGWRRNKSAATLGQAWDDNAAAVVPLLPSGVAVAVHSSDSYVRQILSHAPSAANRQFLNESQAHKGSSFQ